ncbi:MAG: glutamate--tRNA ligase, partial [Clostridia bacterium]|nr:glutamate--tRNA ligase [Clostridia bacterium]
QLMKMEGGSKKKLSKRDLGAGLSFYVAEGYPAKSVKEYVMTLLNSNFEEWRNANPKADINDFQFSIKKMSASGSLFDFDKLNDVSKNTIAHMTADEVYDEIVKWAKEFDTELYELFTRDADYAKRILSIGRGTAKPRKDLCIWKDVKPYVGLFYDELYAKEAEYPETFDKEDIKKALTMFADGYDKKDDANEWFGKMKVIAENLGFAPETKLYKKNPEEYKGHVGDISMFVRIALTGKTNSPDMYEVMNILGEERSIIRIKIAIKEI